MDAECFVCGDPLDLCQLLALEYGTRQMCQDCQAVHEDDDLMAEYGIE
jgi:RNA polymerase-binding transcription factor DksA